MTALASSTFDAPRLALGHLPTPLEPLDRFSSYLGGPRIWIKRDDCTGLATGGNKTRKLEFLLGDALAKDCDTVITYGAVQSNHARQTAAACAKAGIRCHLVLSRSVQNTDPHYESTGNVLLDELLGAHITVVDPTNVAAAASALKSDLERQHRNVYEIPTGGSNEIGALGYVACAHEILTQASELGFEPRTIVVASSSGGTQAGLAVGLGGTSIELVGVNVYDRDESAMTARITGLAHATCLRLSTTSPPAPLTIALRHDFLGAGYGIPSPQTSEAIRTLASLEGILTDPVYSGKALAGLVSMVRSGDLRPQGDTIFVHTGGTSVLSAYSGRV